MTARSLAVLTALCLASCATEEEDDLLLGAQGAALSSPRYEAVFDLTPPPGTPKETLTPTRIRDRLVELIEDADQGAFIRASMFMLYGYCDTGLTTNRYNSPCDGDRLLNALEDAIENRGVHFWLLHEGPGGDSEDKLAELNQRFVDALDARLADTGRQGRFHHRPCVNGCILAGNGHINHNKTWIFSSVKGEPVVLQTSENFTHGQYSRR
jgi:hypothetical protein